MTLPNRYRTRQRGYFIKEIISMRYLLTLIVLLSVLLCLVHANRCAERCANLPSSLRRSCESYCEQSLAERLEALSDRESLHDCTDRCDRAYAGAILTGLRLLCKAECHKYH